MRSSPESGVLTIGDRSRQVARKLRWSIKYYGLALTMLGGVVKALSRLPTDLGATEWYKRVTSRRFDHRFGVATAGYIGLEELGFSNSQKQQATHYQPTASVTFALILSELPIDYHDYVFVDYGSGMGRALVLAAQFPFKAVVGVELSPQLHEIAAENIRRLLNTRSRCRDVRTVCEDATTFVLPNEPLVIYCFHSFREQALTAVLRNLQQSLERSPRHVLIVYQRPLYAGGTRELAEVFDRTAFLRRAPVKIADSRWDIYESQNAIEG